MFNKTCSITRRKLRIVILNLVLLLVFYVTCRIWPIDGFEPYYCDLERYYDGTFFRNNDGLARRGKQKAQLFSNASMDTSTSSLVDQLESLPILCTSHSADQQISMSNKFGRFLKGLSKYASFHAANRQDGKKLIWFCGEELCGGIGDRLRGLTFTLLLAMASQRVLLFDWQDSRRYPPNTFLEPNVIDWQILNTKEPTEKCKFKIMSASNSGGLRSQLTNEKLKSIYQLIAENTTSVFLKSNMFPSSLVFGELEKTVDWIRNSIKSLGLNILGKLEVNKLVGITFRYLFKFSNEIVLKIEEARRFVNLNVLAYVGVHVRTGFKDTLKDGFATSDQIEKNTIDCANETMINQSTIMFLVTDSNGTKNTLVKRYCSGVRTLRNTLIHMDRSKEVSSDERFKNGEVSMWIDLVLLAEAQTVVMPRSGFSFLATTLCLIPKPRVVYGETCRPLEYLVH